MKKERCKLSQLAIKNNVGQRKNDQRLGYVQGESRDKRCYQVYWDGNKYPQVYAKAYINVLSRNLEIQLPVDKEAKRCVLIILEDHVGVIEKIFQKGKFEYARIIKYKQ